ncbi:MAG: hypothetical protein FWF77_00515 [Defluviitaleaceae bacterium]|nr:hypothetical protein [Defluviitaleaceae bacterium]
MGMSDRQFDSHQKNLQRRLEVALKEIEEKGLTDELKKIISDIDEQLKQP